MYPIMPLFLPYIGADGTGLESGSIYIGTANQNPETNPITVYWDVAGTQPAVQPIKTLNGLTIRDGIPANIYFGTTDYSITIRDKAGRLLYSSLSTSLSGVNFYTQFAVLQAQITALQADSFAPGDIIPTAYSQVKDGFLLVPTVQTDLIIADYPNLYAKLVTNSGYSLQTFTVTVASPGVFTHTAHGFLGGERIRLSTSGTLPTGLNTTTDYFVLYVGPNTFNLSLTQGGAAINTSGTQSGTHSYLQTNWGLGDGSTTFGMPWLPAGESWIHGGVFGSHSNGQVINHTHNYQSPAFPQNYTTGPTTQAITGASTTASGNPNANGGATNLPAGFNISWQIKH